MDEKQFKQHMKELSDIKKLLILSTSKHGATQAEIGKHLGISERHLRTILSGK